VEVESVVHLDRRRDIGGDVEEAFLVSHGDDPHGVDAWLGVWG